MLHVLVNQAKNISSVMGKSNKDQFIEGSALCLNSLGTHKIVYSDWGHDNKNIIICIHGLTGNGRDFDFLAPELVKQNYRVIAIDLAGRGRSDFLKDPLDYNYRQYLQDILTVLDHLNINKPASIDWLGVSLGGLLGINLAGEPNTPIKRLILNDVGPEVPKKALKFIYRVIKKLYKFKSLNAFEKRLRKTRGLTWGEVTDEQWQHMAQHNHRKIGRNKLTYAYDHKIALIFKKEPIGKINLWDQWQNIKCPTLALRGGNSLILPIPILEKMQDTAINFQMDTHEFENCGHVPSLMASAQIKVISKWLESTK